jgi:dipeptidyl aminopeptidase/acylaminoacyl peptidase
MTKLEDRIREALTDPRRQLPAWPDPMPRIRSAARRQRAAALAVAAAVAAAVVAGIVTPLALPAGPTGHPASPWNHRLTAHRTPRPPPGGLFAPAAAFRLVPPWAKRLGGEVAYTCGENVCLMRPDGRASRVMAATVPEGDPAWSPDGGDLAFRGYYGTGDGQYDLYAVDVIGCHLTRLTHQMNGTSSSWSPDGRKIAFSGPSGIYVINADGDRPRELLTSLRGDSYSVDTPSWSVTNRIAYTRTPTPRGRPEIYTINPDGTGDAPLTHRGPGYAQPSWSPDGTSVAYTANPYAASSIMIASASGTGAHRVSPPAWTSYSPTWTPGGKIVFLRQTGQPTPNTYAPTSAYIVNPDGTGLRVLYPHLNASQITWGSASLPTAICQPR